MSQSKNWIFTLNNYTDSEVEYVKDITCSFIQFQFEIAPNTNTPHLQGFICFNTNKRLVALKKLLPRAHWQVMKGSVQDCLNYTSKEESRDPMNPEIYTRGDPPVRYNIGERYEEAVELAKSGRLWEIKADLLVRYLGNLTRIATNFHKCTEVLSELTNVWYWGPAGTGKSRRARDESPGAYNKLANKWWDHYNHEEVVLIEDLDISHSVLGHHIKLWADRYPFKAEFKSGSFDIRPKKIVITSNYHPTTIWSDPNMYEPIMRRFTVIEIPSGEAVAGRGGPLPPFLCSFHSQGNGDQPFPGEEKVSDLAGQDLDELDVYLL